MIFVLARGLFSDLENSAIPSMMWGALPPDTFGLKVLKGMVVGAGLVEVIPCRLNAKTRRAPGLVDLGLLLVYRVGWGNYARF
jgi:hypothetical protein